MDTLERIRQANQNKAAQQQLSQQHQDQMQSTAAVQSAIFNSFRSIADMFQDGQTKMSDLFRVVEQLQSSKLSTTEAEVIKAGLKALEKQIKDVPVNDLKQLPKFLERPDAVKINNLKDVKEYFTSLEKAIKALKLNVEAPVVNVPEAVVNVPAPIVNVDAPDMKPLQNGLESVTKAVRGIKYPDRMKTEQQNSLINFEFDEYKLIRDEFEEDEPRVEATVYYLKGKKVARINYKYDDSGNLTGAKRV